jgi:hypothetical protein
VHTATDHHMFKLTSVNELPNLTLRNANASCELLWSLQAIAIGFSHQFISLSFVWRPGQPQRSLPISSFTLEAAPGELPYIPN